jgi:hypothetical protein
VTPGVRPVLVELIGPAGAGKTTLARAIAGRVAGVRTGLRLDRVRDLPAVAASAVRVAPAFASGLLAGTRTAAHDARYSIRLLAHRAAAARALRTECHLIIVDEGPVYMLARLLGFGSAGVEHSRFGREWLGSIDWWRRRLDAVVWLDAPDETLAARIRSRPKRHRAKHASDAALREFLSCYRAAFATVVTRLTSTNGPRAIYVDSAAPVDLEVERVLTALAIRRGTTRTAAADGPDLHVGVAAVETT